MQVNLACLPARGQQGRDPAGIRRCVTLSGVSAVDVVDETFIAALPAEVAAVVGERARWRRWWPDLQLDLHDDRGPAGLRWRVHGAVTGSMELWLEPVLDGTLLHYFLHAEAADLPAADVAREVRRRRLTAKDLAFGLKDELEAGRCAGEPPRTARRR